MSSLTEKYQQYLESKAKIASQGKSATTIAAPTAAAAGVSLGSTPGPPTKGVRIVAGSGDKARVPIPQGSTVGIVGAGAAGLYSALLLKKYRPDISVTIYEASDRVGGRVYTHWFENKPYQYFEAGAMRLPCVNAHQPVFDLIKYLNENLKDLPDFEQNFKLDLIKYNLSDPSGNRVYVNRTKQDDGKIMSVDYANSHFKDLGFSTNVATDEAGKLLEAVIKPLAKEFNDDFKKAVEKYGLDDTTLLSATYPPVV